jgi:D-tyrosyl-tRNA(Tyr) deacylase
MRAVVQRVKRGAVRVTNEVVGEIGPGLVILLGVKSTDTSADAAWLANKCAGLRIFEDERGLMNRGLLEVGGEVLVVSQFTLYGDCEKGRRPSFAEAASPEQAEDLYGEFVKVLRGQGIHVETGSFGSKMAVEILNDGPVTLILER